MANEFNNRLFTVEFDRRSLEDWRAGIHRRFVRNFERAMDETRREWAYEFHRQQESKGDGTWDDLNPIYEKRKNREYPGRLILTRTDMMIPAYEIESERDNRTVAVSLAFPSDPKLNLIAKSHQDFEGVGQPEGVPPRPFDLDPFIEIARREVNDAMKRAAND